MCTCIRACVVLRFNRLGGQTMLTPALRKELQAERERLLHIKQHLEANLHAIEALLVTDDSMQPLQLQLMHEKELVGNGSLPIKGFRDGLREVLSEYPAGLRSREVAERMREKGYRTTGKTDIAVRVRSELSRFLRENKVKRKRQRYFLVEQAQSPEDIND